jgi:hypothetical protein
LYGRRETDNTSTVGIYAIKQNQDSKKQQVLIEKANDIEHIIANDLGQSIKSLGKHITNLHSLLAHVLNVASKMQEHNKESHLQEVKTS